ncbi:Uncharacterised protein [Mycobacteroides abscessus subsp. bolletii]|uniref:Uncharacterized protein n=1 Tax=Mycobacteroides abscessus subsp. bolletii TaxID=319705 RepID=A0A9Q7SEW7_9MYCO|nr:hypothetical protein [Mycobacteroides abscessus]SHT86969.1 Uncharacterised protein [Mycobacteroides abscessus subsp. bolletii]SHU01398.1 Uncharacterised protein [Mycobacteroides abscessus subsp. bolletii]SHX43733.1 Uncharacterised protein [Mycobacteroides abscessus subsp. bolletii]SKM63351.1 Uncharacterised protein [Mycobacteroides abscessus subsp. bolletii]SKN38252.1 Uncharacterised protein [Mycobacteroides abscessus subsp. bolletii]
MSAQTGQQRVDHAALTHGWICNGGTVDDVGLYSYRRPGTASFVKVAYANGIILWADGITSARERRRFDGIGKADRLVSFLAEP